MERAVELAQRCEAEPGRTSPPPKVGVVIAMNGEVLAEAYRGEDPDRPGDHAEFVALGKLTGVELAGAEIYDLNPAIFRQGWRMMRDADLTLRDFPADLREQIRADNSRFLNAFQVVEGDSGTFAFDWNLNDGTLPIRTSQVEFQTKWSTAGRDSIHAYGRGGTSIALARHVKHFSEIHDPGAFPFNNHSARTSR